MGSEMCIRDSTPPAGRGDKLELKHKGPYQVISKLDNIYTIQDLVDGKVITTYITNLREFLSDQAR